MIFINEAKKKIQRLKIRETEHISYLNKFSEQKGDSNKGENC